MGCRIAAVRPKPQFAVLESRQEALELRNNPSIQITAEKSLGDNIVAVTP
jgi:hypothetical protein